MNVSLHYRGLNPRPSWGEMVVAQIRKLQELGAILSAKVILERQRQTKPAFRVFASLEVPGPDFHAEASDYTLHAALLKVINHLRRQIQSRKSHLLGRRKNHSKFGLLHGRSRFILNSMRAAAGRLSPQGSSTASKA